MRSIFVRAATVAALAVTVSGTASAQNLVTNGGFETGNLSGWTTGGCQDHTYTDGTPHSGDYAGYFGQVNSCYGTYTQTLATTPGQTYTISLFAKTDATYGNGLQVYFNGNTLFDQLLTNGDYQQFTMTGTATSTSTTFGFGVYNNPSYTTVDDISVMAAGVTTPEPSSMALLGTGLVGLVPMVRRRRK